MSLVLFFGLAGIITLISTIYLSVACFHHFTKSQYYLDSLQRKQDRKKSETQTT